MDDPGGPTCDATDMLDAALHYRAHGLAAIPCLPRDKRADFGVLRRRGVEGLMTRGWADPFRKHLPSEAQLGDWFASPQNIGLLGGREGLVILDFDEAGSHERWKASQPVLAGRTATQRTARGYHVFVRVATTILDSKLGLGGEVVGDVRARYGHVVVSPSIHPTGVRYEWVPGQAPWECGIARIGSLAEAGVRQVRRQTNLRRYVRLSTAVFRHPFKLWVGFQNRLGRRKRPSVADSEPVDPDRDIAVGAHEQRVMTT